MDDDRVTEIPEDRNAYEFAACVITAPDTIPPEGIGNEPVEATDPEPSDNGQNDYEGGW